MNEKPDRSIPSRRRFNFTNNRLTTPLPAPIEKPLREVPTPLSITQPHLAGRKHLHTDKTGPLIFNVATLLRDPEGSHRDYDYEQDRLALALEPGLKPTEATNIKGHVRLTRIRHEVLTQGPGEADVVLECVRCLNDFDYHVEYMLEELFRPSIDIISGLVVKTENLDEEADLKLDANHLLNLGEAIRQQILVSLPIKPICGEDCPGFNSELERINATSTIPDLPEEDAQDDEPPPIIDKRWAALTQLLPSTDDSK